MRATASTIPSARRYCTASWRTKRTSLRVQGSIRLILLGGRCDVSSGTVLAIASTPQRGAVMRRRTLSSEQAQDVNKIVAYGSSKTALKYIAFSVLVLAVGLVVAFGKKDWLLGGPLAALAAAAIVWQINGLLSAEPLLRLSPAGLRLNLDGSVFVDIPWREVEAISSLNLTFEVVQKRWYDLQGGHASVFPRERSVPGCDRVAGFRGVRRSNDPASMEGGRPNQGVEGASRASVWRPSCSPRTPRPRA
jgi:hypothetical protein